MRLTKLSLVALFSCTVMAGGLGAAEQGKSLYNYDNGTTQGWWVFKGGGSELEISAAKPGANNSDGALKAVYKNGKSGSYLGIGIQPKWAMGGKADFAAYAKGALLISLKGDAAMSLKIELRMENKETYSFTINDIGMEWKDYVVKFEEFKGKEKVLNLTATPEIAQIVLMPKSKDGASHTLLIDEIKVVEAAGN